MSRPKSFSSGSSHLKLCSSMVAAACMAFGPAAIGAASALSCQMALMPATSFNAAGTAGAAGDAAPANSRQTPRPGEPTLR
ncbi:hypothetical protein WG899_14150 [Paucibacter sp. AS339]|uniref:hypothetical protein n=1 Tax=Paucibacter hankyongi TaxID=3133434 RepID=UPI0030AAD834